MVRKLRKDTKDIIIISLSGAVFMLGYLARNIGMSLTLLWLGLSLAFALIIVLVNKWYMGYKMRKLVNSGVTQWAAVGTVFSGDSLLKTSNGKENVGDPIGTFTFVDKKLVWNPNFASQRWGYLPAEFEISKHSPKLKEETRDIFGTKWETWAFTTPEAVLVFQISHQTSPLTSFLLSAQ